VDNALMNGWQTTLYDLVFVEQLVQPKRVAARLHRHPDYLSDICRRDRVDPVAAFNAILQEAQAYFPADPQRSLAIAHRVFKPLLIGTSFYVNFTPPNAAMGDLGDLRNKVGSLLRDLAGAVDSLCEIESDGEVDADDDPSIAEFDLKVNRLTGLLSQLHLAIHTRRNAAGAAP